MTHMPIDRNATAFIMFRQTFSKKMKLTNGLSLNSGCFTVCFGGRLTELSKKISELVLLSSALLFFCTA